MKHATRGTWDPRAWPRYFIAGSLTWVHVGVRAGASDALVAVNEIVSDDAIFIVEDMIARGCNVLLDSGVFNLANQHALSHGISMDAALSLAPRDIDGFDDLYARYVTLCRRFGDGLWGAVEIDQGGRENKRITRARLEDLGIRPIPVYHPINDGWDYFDELAETYDRVCFGNVVQADQEDRKRLVATAWQRRQRHPDTWVHLLGLTPYATTVAFPANSCDSSTWLGSVRWGRVNTWAATQSMDSMGYDFVYDREAHAQSARSGHRSVQLSAYDATMIGRTMRRIVADQRATLGACP